MTYLQCFSGGMEYYFYSFEMPTTRILTQDITFLYQTLRYDFLYLKKYTV